MGGRRSLIFGNVITRVGKDYKLAFHIDTDEGNASYTEQKGELLIKKK